MRYGVPYKGSKNSIAEWVYSHFPKADNFYDLFAGGCAITQIALMRQEYKNYIANDIDADGIKLFLSAINGQFQNETRWISREDFFKLKDKEPYIKYCWSFGNNGFNYLYSKEVEPWKKALHYAHLFGDFSFFKSFGIETDGTNADIIRNMEKYKQQYILWYCKNILHSSLDVLELQKDLSEKVERNSEELRNYLLEGLKKAGKKPSEVDRYLGTKGMSGHYFGKSQWAFPTRDVYIKLQSFLSLPLEYEKIYGLQELLQSLQSLQSLQRLEISKSDYRNMEIKPDSLIYCDIPYRNTDGYQEEGFDHEEFYSWCERQTEPVLISEYWMPEDRFECIDEIEKTVTLQSGAGNKVIEKLFIPRHQKYDKWQGTLFEGLL